MRSLPQKGCSSSTKNAIAQGRGEITSSMSGGKADTAEWSRRGSF